MLQVRKFAAFLAIVLLVCLLCSPTEALKRKNRIPNGGKLSLFNPFIVLDEEDQRELGRAGLRFAKTHKIVSRNPILLIPGTLCPLCVVSFFCPSA